MLDTFQTGLQHWLLSAPVWLLGTSLFLVGCKSLDDLSGRYGSRFYASENRIRIVEHDVETPQIFDLVDAARWDGQTTLGGVWVAHPFVDTPRRVVVRNPSKRRFVIGNLFRNAPLPGAPRIRVSEDAAHALGLSAGEISQLQITALENLSSDRRPTLSQNRAVDRQSIAPAPKKPNHKNLVKPYLQIAFFSAHVNAIRTKERLAAMGVATTLTKRGTNSKPVWQVTSGPLENTKERKRLLVLVQSKGFSDAYAVIN